MSSFIRGKQTGMQNDLSASILPEHFHPDDRSRYGINSQISCMAFDPVQSLLAVGTNESKFGSGRVYVYGQNRVQKLLVPPRSSSFADLHFCANRLVSLDTKNECIIWDLDSGKRLASFHAPGFVTSMVTDPMLDWCFLGMQNGEVFAYDLDTERLSPFRLPNFWASRDPAARAVTLVSMQLHPRDVGKLMIAYSTGLAIYSFKQNQPTQFFEYHVPPGAPGGSGHATDSVRKPKITQALWHPTGTFILTAHDDGSLVFWDSRDGRVVMARNLYDMDVEQPGPANAPLKPKHPYVRIAWCCKSNPEDSALLIAGGQNLDSAPGLTFLNLGVTPNYATSSWQILSEYCKGKQQVPLDTPPGAVVADFCLIPRVSPHFAGAQDPIAIITLLTSGEIITLSFPSGYPISPTNQLHPSLSFVHPFATKFAVTVVDRPRWLSMVETRTQGESLLKGGAEAPRPRHRFEGRTIIQIAHADSTVRIWDVGHDDAIENSTQVQVDVARSLGRYEDIDVTSMSMARNTGEFAVGTSGGEVVIYRWGGNKNYGHDAERHLDPNPGGLTDISGRAEPSLKTGLQPFLLYEMMQGPITTVRASDVGFMAVGSEGGFLTIIDMRGPAIMFQASMTDFHTKDKRASFRRSSSHVSTKREWPVEVQFGVMSVDEDSYSSICCFVGTNLGRLLTFKVLPSGGGYTAQFAGVATLSDRVVSICPIVAETGRPAYATGDSVAGLREGKHVNGLLVVVTQTEVRIFKPCSAKGASKTFDGFMCSAAAVTEVLLHGMALVCVFGDRVTRAFSLPGLKELGSAHLPMMDGSRADGTVVTDDGDLFCWAGPSELAILDVWGSGKDISQTADTLINPSLAMPPRPTISNVQWLSGTQHVTTEDLDLLIGGPDRPPSKRAISTAAPVDLGAGTGAAGSSSAAAGTSQEGWGDYLTRQLNERTEKLNLMSEGMDNTAEASQKWAEGANKWVNKQKRNMFLGSIAGKFS